MEVVHVVLNVWVIRGCGVGIVMSQVKISVSVVWNVSVAAAEDFCQRLVLFFNKVTKGLMSKVGWLFSLRHEIMQVMRSKGNDHLCFTVSCAEFWLEELSDNWLAMQVVLGVTDKLMSRQLVMRTGVEFTMRHIEVIVMDWLVISWLESVVLVFMRGWSDGLKHIMMRFLDEIGGVVVDWLSKNGLMVTFRVIESFCLVVHWFLQVHLMSMDGVRPVMLNGGNDIYEF